MLSPTVPIQYDGVPMYAPGTPVAVSAPALTYELIPYRIFVGGFSATTTEVELRQHFEQYCTIREAKVIRSAEGVSKGYGFLTFETEEEAERAKNLSAEKLELKGRRLNVGPALRKMNGHRLTDYAIATPTGIVPSPTLGYGYSFPPHTPYVLMGAPQPTAFVYATTPPQSATAFANQQQLAPENGSGDQNVSSPMKPTSPLSSVPQPLFSPSAYYVPVPGTPVAPGGPATSPTAVYSPAPFFMPHMQDNMQYQPVQTGYYYPQQQNYGNNNYVCGTVDSNAIGQGDVDRCFTQGESGVPRRSESVTQNSPSKKQLSHIQRSKGHGSGCGLNRRLESSVEALNNTPPATPKRAF